MDKVEKDLLDELKKAENDRHECKEEIRKLQKKLTDTETALIEATIKRDRIREKLRVYHNTTVKVVITDREQEIEAFRQKYPELCKNKNSPDI